MLSPNLNNEVECNGENGSVIYDAKAKDNEEKSRAEKRREDSRKEKTGDEEALGETGRERGEAHRRTHQGIGRLAWEDAGPSACADQASRPRHRRRMEMERAGVVARRHYLYRRNIQKRGEADICERRETERSGEVV